MHKHVQYEVNSRTEKVLRIKKRNFKNSCLKNCYRMLKFANIENGCTDIQRDILSAMWNILPTS